LKIHDSERILFLENLCDSIDYDELISDNVLVSPVFDEISSDLLEKLKSISGFIFLDPQGFLRRKGINNKIYLESTDLNLSKISAIKTSPDELNALTGISTIDGMNVLQKKGIEYVILTDKQNISLLFDGKIYSLKLPNIELYDTTGIGDIFSTTFCCTIIKEKDFLWALSFAAGSAQAALENKKIGLDKIPSRGAIETNATYFYNTVKFREI
jgi:sugar/nucleoside kinase (ribokinase family)